MGFKKISMIITMFVMLSATARATTAYIKPPYLEYTFYIDEGEENTFQGAIEIKNRNNFPVTVVFSASDWIDAIDSIELDPNEQMDVEFNMVFTQAGNYSGDITAAYTAPGKFTASAGSSITVHAIAESSATTTTLPPTTTTTSTTTSTTTTSSTTTTIEDDFNEDESDIGTTTSSTTTTLPERAAALDQKKSVAEDPITINIVRESPGIEMAALSLTIIGTIVAAIFILRR